MRALILGIICACAIPAKAASPSTSFREIVKSERGSTGLTNANSNSTTSQVSSFDFQSGSHFSNFDLRFGIDRAKTDYGRYVLTDRAGTQTELSRSFKAPEHTLRVGSSVFRKQFSISLDGALAAGATPFPGNSGAVVLSQEILKSGTKLKIGILHSDHKSPASYYVDPDNFSTRVRPNRNLENRVTVGAEQILSETTKLKTSLFVGDKPGTRPLQRGAEFGFGKALSDSAAVIGSVGLAREKESDPLVDDRGYFKANWAQVEFRFQPSYRWQFSAKVGTILESESARGRLPEHRVGTDTFGLSTTTRWKIGEIGVYALGARANSGYSALSFGGNLIWNL